MNITALAHALRIAAPLAALALASASAAAQSQSWNYRAYARDRISGQPSRDRFVTATITLEEKDGKASFRMLTPGRGDPCISRGELPAEVERGADTTTITVLPTLTGCQPFRYVIRNDGTGGVRYNRRGESWTPDGLDHDLTPAK